MPTPSPLALCLKATSLAALTAAQSMAIGDLDSSTSLPYGLPSRVFSVAASHPNATNSYPIPGFASSNSSSSSDDDDSSSGNSIWALRIHVTADVPLSDADDADDADDDDVTQLTVMSLTNPMGREEGEGEDDDDDDDDAGACAFVFRGLDDDATKDAQDEEGTGDGCGDVLSDECVEDLEEAARDAGEGCEAFDVPESCEEGGIGRGTEGWGESLSFNASSSGRFFAHASSPHPGSSSDAEEAWAIAATNVWPVLFSWNGGSSDSDSDRHVELRCVRAGNTEQGSDEVDDVPDRNFDDEENDDSGSGGGSGDDSDEDDDNAAAGVAKGGVLGVVGGALAVAMMVAV